MINPIKNIWQAPTSTILGSIVFGIISFLMMYRAMPFIWDGLAGYGFACMLILAPKKFDKALEKAFTKIPGP